MNNVDFEKWVEGEIQKGLVDFKVSIVGTPSADLVKSAILEAEAKIAAGMLRNPPTPIDPLPGADLSAVIAAMMNSRV